MTKLVITADYETLEKINELLEEAATEELADEEFDVSMEQVMKTLHEVEVELNQHQLQIVNTSRKESTITTLCALTLVIIDFIILL